MKRVVCLIFLALTASSVHAATITKEQVVGAWVSQDPVGFKSRIIHWLAEPTPARLEISKDLAVTFTRHFKDGQQVLKADPSMVSFDDDLMTIKFPKTDQGLELKLVLSGWSIAAGKRLFGQLYLYDKDGLFNGMSVSFEPEHGS